MKISVDGGALNQKIGQRFGTAVFSENLIRSLQTYDRRNTYRVYTFENLKPKIFWMKGRISIEEFKKKNDAFLALNQALPLYVAGKIISFCHGLSYRFYPELYSEKDVIRLNKQLGEMIKRSDKIVVSSERIRRELASIDQLIDAKIIVIPFGIPLDMINKPPFPKDTADKQKNFLFVANNQQIKNIDFILQSFNRLKCDDEFKNYKLYLVGNWRKYENKKQGIFVFENISRQELRKLYQQSMSLLTASHYESFNFPVLEALSQGCPVTGLKSAIIPELKPYVNVAGNLNEFVDLMKSIRKKPSVRSIKHLYKKFSWKKYVKNLVKLY